MNFSTPNTLACVRSGARGGPGDLSIRVTTSTSFAGRGGGAPPLKGYGYEVRTKWGLRIPSESAQLTGVRRARLGWWAVGRCRTVWVGVVLYLLLTYGYTPPPSITITTTTTAFYVNIAALHYSLHHGHRSSPRFAGRGRGDLASGRRHQHPRP